LGTVATDEILGISKKLHIHFAADFEEHICIIVIGYLPGQFILAINVIYEGADKSLAL
jgi:hypothetical protein